MNRITKKYQKYCLFIMALWISILSTSWLPTTAFAQISLPLRTFSGHTGYVRSVQSALDFLKPSGVGLRSRVFRITLSVPPTAVPN